jgi:predicted secreted protein
MSKYAAFGTLLKAGNGASPEVFTAIAQGQDITGPAQKADTIDVTTHDDTSPYKAFIAGLVEGGDVKMPIVFDPALASHTGLITNFEARVPTNYQLVLPTSPSVKWSFAGLITDLSHTYKMKDAIMADLTIKVSGRPVLA